jgi:drug/metabolite transporter, DME family
MDPPARPAAPVAAMAMLGAAALWGVVGGRVAGLEASGLAAASMVELVTGAVLTALAWSRGQTPAMVVRALRGSLLLLGAIEAVNVATYYAALQLAPVGPVMALHLCAPILLSVLALMQGRRRLTLGAGASLALTTGALVLIGLDDIDNDAYHQPYVGYLLALASAGCLAVFVTGVGAAAGRLPPEAAAGGQMFVSGLLLSPALLGLADHPADAATLALLSVLLFAPACWLYWFAMRRLTPITASTVLLAEPFFGVAAAVVAYGLTPSPLQAIAAVVVLLATLQELRRRPRVTRVSEV